MLARQKMLPSSFLATNEEEGNWRAERKADAKILPTKGRKPAFILAGFFNHHLETTTCIQKWIKWQRQLWFGSCLKIMSWLICTFALLGEQKRKGEEKRAIKRKRPWLKGIALLCVGMNVCAPMRDHYYPPPSSSSALTTLVYKNKNSTEDLEGSWSLTAGTTSTISGTTQKGRLGAKPSWRTDAWSMNFFLTHPFLATLPLLFLYDFTKGLLSYSCWQYYKYRRSKHTCTQNCLIPNWTTSLILP